MTVGLTAAYLANRKKHETAAATQYESAANPVLTNPQFANSQGWMSVALSTQ